MWVDERCTRPNLERRSTTEQKERVENSSFRPSGRRTADHDVKDSRKNMKALSHACTSRRHIIREYAQ
jgi:hypothetical protein